MNLKRAKLLLTAFVLAVALFSLLLTTRLPSLTVPSARAPLGRERADPVVSRVAVTSLSREDSPVATPSTAAPSAAAPSAAARSAAAPSAAAPSEMSSAGKAPGPPPDEPRDRDSAAATVDATRDDVSDAGSAASGVADEPQALPRERTGRAAASSRTPSAPEAPRTSPPVPDEMPERPRLAPAPRAPRSESRKSALEADASALEKLLSTTEAAPADTGEPSGTEKPEARLVTELERLFGPATSVRPSIRSEPAVVTRSGAQPSPATTSLPPEAVPRTAREFEARQRSLRALAREEDTDVVSAVFRLEQQDPETFRSVMAQYRMDILLEIPSRGTYSIIPHGGDYWDRTEYRKGEDDLRKRYGLSVRDLRLSWLEKLRETHVATELLSSESVEAALLVPRREAEILLGSIVLGCRSLGHSLEEVSACYGTFVERVLSGKRLFDYQVTRLVLRDGTLVEVRRT